MAATPPARGLQPWLAALGATVVVGAIVMAFYLSIYPAKGFTVPIGWDTSRYLWRTSVARDVGLAHLQQAVPASIRADPSRPAWPVVGGTLSALTGVTTFRLAAVLPSVLIAAVALACGALVGASLRRPPWEVIVVALAIGPSAFMVRLAGPETYQDNLFAAAAFVAAAIPIVASARDRRALLPAALLLGAGGVIHWAFFGVMVATLALATLALVPASWRSWRAGRSALADTPAARMAAVMAGGLAVASVTLFGILRASTQTPRLSVSEFAKKLAADLPKYRFPITLPLAAAGAGSLAAATRGRDDEDRSRAAVTLTVLLAWCAVALAGLVAFRVFDVPVPAHRFLAFAIAIPILAVLGVLWAGRALARLARPLGAIAVIGVLIAGGFVSHVQWFRTKTWIDPAKVREAATAGDYLDAAGVADDRPIVFVVRGADASYTALMNQMIRAALPAERTERTYLYGGSPDAYLAGRPTTGQGRGPDALSRRYFGAMRGTYGQNPVAVLLQSANGRAYGPWVREHPGSVVGPGVAVVRGPVLPSPVPAGSVPVGPFSPLRLALLAGALLAALGLTGLGWTLALLRRWLRPIEVLAAAPAVGVAALVLVGVLLDRLGVRPVGLGGALTPAIVAVAGGLALAVSVSRERRSRGGR